MEELEFPTLFVLIINKNQNGWDAKEFISFVLEPFDFYFELKGYFISNHVCDICNCDFAKWIVLTYWCDITFITLLDKCISLWVWLRHGLWINQCGCAGTMLGHAIWPSLFVWLGRVLDSLSSLCSFVELSLGCRRVSEIGFDPMKHFFFARFTLSGQ